MTYAAHDLFAGMGGWSTGLRALGLRELGIEHDRDCRATRRAAGHHTVLGDVGAHYPAQFPPAAGLIASPPCQTFSKAGKGSGRRNLDAVTLAVKATAARQIPDAGYLYDDPRTGLVVEPLRWVVQALDLGRPYRWIALEQVRSVLPVWEAYAEVLRTEGYHVVTGSVNAEQYGVPQTRVRAVLLAHLDRPVSLPVPTHSRFYVKDRTRVDPGVPRWVSMADALGWQFPDMAELLPAAATFPDDRTKPRQGGEPSLTVAFGHNAANWRWRVSNQSGTAWDESFPWLQPAPVIAGRPLVTFPGANANRFNGSTKSRNDGLRVTLDEVLRLQSFPGDYPVSGTTDRSRFRQVGDAVPPLLAQALLGQVIL